MQDALAQDFDDLAEHAISLCGTPHMIDEAQAMRALSGVRIDKIYSDSLTFQPVLAS